MLRAPLSADDLLIARLQASPDLADGIESLAYWRERSRRLPWYRIRARREAARMTLRWERRVRGALVSQRGVPVAIRVSAGVLIARTRLRRWNRRAAVALIAMVGITLIVLPVIAATATLIRVL